MKSRSIQILAGIGLYLLTTGISYAAFTSVGGGISSDVTSPLGTHGTPTPKKKFKVDPSIPRDQVCPLNGMLYTKNEKDVWSTRRPLSVMIENSPDARPHSGLSRADVVYEANVEGLITRFMAVFYCNSPFENIAIAPVRSARASYLNWVSEYDALYNHVGGANRNGENAQKTAAAADALGLIDQYGIKDLDQFGIGYPDCYRNPDRLDKPVATEHTMVCFSDNLFKIAEKRGWTNVDQKGVPWDKNFTPWTFKDDAAQGSRGSTTAIAVAFAPGKNVYEAQWEYDAANNVYKRKTGGEPHLDLETKEQIIAKNVVMMVAKVNNSVDELGHVLFDTIGTGKALVFQDGNVVTGTWTKKSRIGRTTFTGPNGKELPLNRGMVWIGVVGDEKQVTY